VTRRQFLGLVMPLLAVLVGFVALSVGERVGGAGMPPWDEGFSHYVRRTFAREFVSGVGDERQAAEAYFNALQAWVRTWDNYADIVPPWEVEARRERSSGQYHGIGIRIEYVTEGPRVVGIDITGVAPGGPAEQVGLQVGDRIVRVGGRPVGEIFEALADDPDAPGLEVLIRGPKGTEVELSVRAPDGTERDVGVRRDDVDHGSVFGLRMLDAQRGIGYARVSNFHMSTSEELERGVAALVEQGLHALVLDLRDNSGGILPEAIEVADLFLDKGRIVTVRGRGAQTSETHDATARTPFRDLQLAVLINRASASASEVLAGALQDHARATMVGERSYGKFLVQTVEEFETRFGPALFKRTTAIYETPHGHFYPRMNPAPDAPPEPLAGIRPDLYVPMSAAELHELRRKIFDSEIWQAWNPALQVPYDGFVDAPLQAALALLRGESYEPRIPGLLARE